MLVRILTGRDRGELRDVAPDVGRLWLADGRATYPCPDQHPSQLASDLHRDREELGPAAEVRGPQRQVFVAGVEEVKARASRPKKSAQ